MPARFHSRYICGTLFFSICDINVSTEVRYRKTELTDSLGIRTDQFLLNFKSFLSTPLIHRLRLFQAISQNLLLYILGTRETLAGKSKLQLHF